MAEGRLLGLLINEHSKERVIYMKIHIKNQMNGKIEFCCGEKEYELEPGQKITIEVNDEDCMYFDQFIRDDTHF